MSDPLPAVTFCVSGAGRRRDRRRQLDGKQPGVGLVPGHFRIGFHQFMSTAFGSLPMRLRRTYSAGALGAGYHLRGGGYDCVSSMRGGSGDALLLVLTRDRLHVVATRSATCQRRSGARSVEAREAKFAFLTAGMTWSCPGPSRW